MLSAVRRQVINVQAIFHTLGDKSYVLKKFLKAQQTYEGLLQRRRRVTVGDAQDVETLH